ncbi:MAG: MmcQ/YjbR family DNA-binding protein [Chthoniobacterales bacterium]|nr:MmcQ/YjbR family DNA-binding protein [Chthoniobacterales bacterium]
MTADEFRRLALAVPTSFEQSHMRHPDFRVAGKIFASLGVPDEVKLAPDQQRAFIKKAPKIFKPCPGAWGRRGYTNVYLPVAGVAVVREALDAAAKNACLKKK